MTHFSYVLLAYGISALAILAMVVWIMVTQRNLQAELARLEQQGIRRRSNKADAA